MIEEKGEIGEGNKIQLKGIMHMKRGWKACKEARTELERMLGKARCANVLYTNFCTFRFAKRKEGWNRNTINAKGGRKLMWPGKEIK